jgi:DNA repair protein RecN (Recombination protein N)
MLSRLSIRDFAVVAHAELAFGDGLTVISGETGAGKSLLVDALDFLCGARADASAVRHGSQRAELEAEFLLADCPAAVAWLHDNDLDDGSGCQLRRTLRADGGSRAWINGRAASLSQLAELAALLVGIHGQHEQQALLARATQTALLDSYARHPGLLDGVRMAARRWQQLDAERSALLARGDVADRRAWLRHQLDELEAESLDQAALAELDAAHRRQAHAATLVAACEQALDGLGGDDALPQRARKLQAILQRETTHEPRLVEVEALLESATIQLNEALASLQRIRIDLDLDPDTLASLEQRLARVHDLARKHRVAPAALATHRDALAAEWASLEDAGERLQTLDRDIAQAHADWRNAATQLTRSRQQAGAALADAVGGMIASLGMQGGRFEIALPANEDTATPDPLGAERAEFLVSANPGQPPKPLRKVASGGELSRISLAIEVATLGPGAGLGAVPTMVFDEVDAGIGGAVAAAVGARLRALGSNRQVLCVTHQPQVAAAGHAHYRVSKAAQDGITQSSVVPLDDDARTEEIARMLGGSRLTAEARAAARQLQADAAG